MLASNKSADTLENNFECVDDPPQRGCPLMAGVEPHISNDTGEAQCPLCYRVVGQETSDDEQVFDDDIIDEEEAMSLDMKYVAEVDKIQTDQTDEQKATIRRKDAITAIISLIVPIDMKYAEYMSDNQDAILTMLGELEDAGIDDFQTGKNIRPKVLAIASHMKKGLPNSKALRVLEVKTSDILRRKAFLDKTYTSKVDNIISMNISDIGQSLEIPTPIISKAIDMYEKDLPPNKEPKDRVKAAAWLYSYLKQKTDMKPKKGDFYLPGISRISFNRAVSSYKPYFEQ